MYIYYDWYIFYWDKKMIYYLIFLFAIFLASIAQVLLKKSATYKHERILNIFINKKIVIAYAIMIVSSFLCVVGYKKIPLHHGPLLESLSYIFIAIFGKIFFNEQVKCNQIIGLMFILFGVTIIAI